MQYRMMPFRELQLFTILCWLPLHLMDAKYGWSEFRCPNGHYLSNIHSAFHDKQSDARRFYHYSCRPLVKEQLIEFRNCRYSNKASSRNGDMLLTCNGDEFVAGLSMLEENVSQKWKLICCDVPSLETHSCRPSDILNDFKGTFNYEASKDRLIRKLLSIYSVELEDRKWWLETCEFKIPLTRKLRDSGLPISGNYDTMTRSLPVEETYQNILHLRKSISNQRVSTDHIPTKRTWGRQHPSTLTPIIKKPEPTLAFQPLVVHIVGDQTINRLENKLSGSHVGNFETFDFQLPPDPELSQGTDEDPLPLPFRTDMMQSTASATVETTTVEPEANPFEFEFGPQPDFDFDMDLDLPHPPPNTASEDKTPDRPPQIPPSPRVIPNSPVGLNHDENFRFKHPRPKQLTPSETLNKDGPPGFSSFLGEVATVLKDVQENIQFAFHDDAGEFNFKDGIATTVEYLGLCRRKK